MSVNALARELGISQPFLSRALRGVDHKRATPSLVAAIARALSVPPEHFLDYRRWQVIDRLERDPDLTNAVYEQFLEGSPVPSTRKRRR